MTVLLKKNINQNLKNENITDFHMTEKRNKSMSEKKQYIRPELSVEELTKALYEANKELDAVNRELACANETLEKNEKSRSEMFANISHDLRSPIAAIRSAVEYILSDKDIKKDDTTTNPKRPR